MTIQAQRFGNGQSDIAIQPGKPIQKNQAHRKVRILSIDGGGIRGIIPATILAYLEDRLKKESANPEARLSDYFDFFAGTSTGGILVCAYLSPQKLSAQQALDLYLNHGQQIFNRPLKRKIRSLFGLADEKYSAKALEKILRDKLGAMTKLSEFAKPCLITAYNITDRKAVFFTSKEARRSASKDYKAWQVARATSAAPTYFEPAMVKTESNFLQPLVDGGVFANNPTMCAFIEARKTAFSHLMGNTMQPEDAMVVSIGTGSTEKPYQYEDMRKKGAIGWLRPIIDILMASNAETVHYQLKKLFQNDQQLSNYYRLEPGIHHAHSAIDNVKGENLAALHQAGLHFIDQNEEELNEIVRKLIEAG